jgi:hypothetical protein
MIGYDSYLLVRGSIHQWGFAWRDGMLTVPGGAVGAGRGRRGPAGQAGGVQGVPG